ncbi:hypothetical protein IC582_009332 [Cucumis melo]
MKPKIKRAGRERYKNWRLSGKNSQFSLISPSYRLPSRFLTCLALHCSLLSPISFRYPISLCSFARIIHSQRRSVFICGPISVCTATWFILRTQVRYHAALRIPSMPSIE